jgi:hypothetical protein
MSKVAAWITTIVGAILLAAGLVLLLVVAPATLKFPADTDVTRDYQGTMTTMLNPQTFEFVNDVPIELKRHFTCQETDGNLALVKEEKTMTGGGQPLQQVTSNYSIDRTTMVFDSDCPDAWKETEGFLERGGLVLGWPIGTEQKDYDGWSDDYMSIVPLTFDSEVTHERSGMKTYLFTSESGPKPIVPEMVAAMGLPTSLPKDQLAGLVVQAKLPPMVAEQLPKILESVSGEMVPLQYYYAYEGKYWIDPTTGVMIDTEKHEVRKVGLSEDIPGMKLLAMLPEEQKDQARIAVSDFTYTATDQSVQDAKKDAEDAGGTIKLVGTWLPWIGIIVGAVVLVLGVVMLVRKPAAAA